MRRYEVELGDIYRIMGSPQSMVQRLKKENRTPYFFLRGALRALSEDAEKAASAWTEYALLCMDFYQDNESERFNFELVCVAINSLNILTRRQRRRAVEQIKLFLEENYDGCSDNYQTGNSRAGENEADKRDHAVPAGRPAFLEN